MRMQERDRTPMQNGSWRSPADVMRLARMGSAHPTRLSFLRVLLRRLQNEGWKFTRPVWDLNDKGVGRAVYCAIGPERTYSLVAFAHDLPEDMRSDRVIATAWDATFALFDGVPEEEDLDRLERNVPLQEAGRVSVRELSLSRANRSVRLFNHVVDRLSRGSQPDIAEIEAVGYLMRTTAVYGAGKFGAADHDVIRDRPEFKAPFQVEMLSVWLTRQFCADVVEHLAEIKGGDKAVRLSPEVKARLGVGNSTGLGMAPFIIRHPVLLNNWITAREEALARVRSLEAANPEAVSDLRKAYENAKVNLAQWHSEHPIQIAKLDDLRRDFNMLEGKLQTFPATAGPSPWNDLWLWGQQSLSVEGQEALLSLMLEPHGELIDGLSDCMSADEATSFRIDGAMTNQQVRSLLDEHYTWALATDFSQPENTARFWYVSEEKLEPRLGERNLDDGAEREQPLCIGRLASELHAHLSKAPDNQSIAEFLLRHPEHRFIVRRVQLADRYPFAEVQDNLISNDMLPIDLMRCKLAFFGATHFDPRSDKWVRICLFQGAPYPLEHTDGTENGHG
ncbi:hypothetical protein [Roseibium sp. SCP14]|uniref:hypothetical protein n=1 Tax=Roseibium sp. SCP14 TaxID=3141375 RepID=UPI0033385404